MKEITFLRQNHQKWLEFENLLNAGNYSDPDALADLFVQITDDLSWARTFYPGSNTEKYLNDLAARIHQEIYKNKKERRSRLLTFWSKELPLVMRNQQMSLWVAFLIFALSCWVGAVSANYDEGFVRLILGDGYVDMTLENIEKGDPLGVYKSENHFVMFLRIAMNNSFVAVLCILAGMLHWIGVGFLLFRNGVMLGAFMFFLADHGQLHEATYTVWIHGTIEIWCIIVAGAGGIALGNALYFPGAWPRGVAFRKGAREALKIAIGLIPFFFLAAFFEGFLTRFTQMNDTGRLMIILGSLVFVLWYFVIYPFILASRIHRGEVPAASLSTGARILTWIAILVSAPVSLIILSVLKVQMGKDRVPVIFYLTRGVQTNPETVSRIFLGMILILLPSIAFMMQLITGIYPELTTYLFFLLCYGGGIALIVRAAFMINRQEEDDLKIERISRVKETEYESKGTSVKV